jgi:NAD(P)-dependent dehydrogenase (short-subunit alcohol dehydrogenase family)
VPGDVGDPEVAERVARTAVKRYGCLDTLVNNADIFISKPFVDYTADEYAAVLNINLARFFFVTQHSLRQMLKKGRGHIVQITTTLADQPIKAVPAALALLTKGRLCAVTRSLAIEYADNGIRVNAVSPAIFRTLMHAENTHEFLAGLHPLRRLGEIGEIVDAVLYLESAKFVTGEVLHVDGGQNAGK